MAATKLRAGQLRGMSIGTSHPAATAWIQYSFDDKNHRVTIQVYRYSWVVWEQSGPITGFGKLRARALEFCETWKFLFVRERVLQEMSERYILKHQDGTPVDPEEARKREAEKKKA